MPTTRTWIVLLGCGAGLAAQTVDAARPTAEEPRMVRDVQLLLSRQTADAALQAILARGEHRGPGDYTETVKPSPVKHVVMCPQPAGLPIFAVFVRGVVDTDYREPKGHLIQVAADGAIVRCWRGHNVVAGTFADVNEDGIVDRVDTIDCRVEGGIVRELYVLPITEQCLPALRVAIGFQPGEATHGKEPQIAWRVQRAGDGKPARIQIGPRDAQTGELTKVTAEWSWLAARSSWIGPGGGPGHAFVRLPPEGWAGLEEFAAAQTQGSPKRER